MKFEFDCAQICLNGHLINRAVACLPENNRNFCSNCGQKAITNCEGCGAEIRGSVMLLKQVFNDPYTVPFYCDNCGSAFPWTKARQEAAFELVDLAENLSSDEKEGLRNSIPALAMDTPKTGVAVIKFKQYVAKAGVVIGNGLKDILVDVVSETVKKAIWPDS